jgi:UTP:GlnB (protein PII) uridylyltransferase
MPSAYWAHFGVVEATEHAEIVGRRNTEVALVEQWLPLDSSEIWLCVVTDDRPGLLASLCAAITAHSLDILEAKIYCRPRENAPTEAIDFFCVKPIKSIGFMRLSDTELMALRNTITAVLSGDTDVLSLQRHSTPTGAATARPETSVHIEEIEDGDILIVETDDRPGLLAQITLALFKTKVTIVSSNVTTIAGRVRDEFQLLRADGGRLGMQSKHDIVWEVLSALDWQARRAHP